MTEGHFQLQPQSSRGEENMIEAGNKSANDNDRLVIRMECEALSVRNISFVERDRFVHADYKSHTTQNFIPSNR